MASSPGSVDVEAQRQQISLILADVLRVIEKLLHSLVLGTADGPIASHFGNFDIDPDEGPYFTVNCAWERTFQKTGEAVITGGQYGVKLVHDFLAHFLHIPGIEANGGLDLMLRHVHQLAEMLQKVSVAARAKDGSGASGPLTSSLKIKLKKGVSKPSALNKQASQQEGQAEEDPDYVPPRRDPISPQVTDSEDSDRAIRKKPGCKRKAAIAHCSDPPKAKKSRKAPESGSSGNEDDNSDTSEVEKLANKAGREQKKGHWTFSHFIPSPATDKSGKAVWKWACNWCLTYQTSPRTSKCVDYANETLSQPPSSNFSSHLNKCKGLPASHSFEAWCLQNDQSKSAQAQDTPNDIAQTPQVGVEQPKLSSLAAQRDSMKAFIQCGIDNPAKQVTVKGFREHLVKGIIEDDLPFTLGEKPGMKRTFTYLLPYKFSIPGRQTVRRDLNLLHDHIQDKLNNELRENKSKLSIHLPGGHTGAESGKLIFQSLRKRKIETKLIANVSDNTASNNLMNRAISKRLMKASRAIFHALGAAPDPDKHDLFIEARAFPVVYDPDEDEAVIEETELMATEAKSASSTHDGGLGRLAESDT
ncbi:hypothetical protein BDN67DRAFT_984264, partial [Paxillus ammoniavirescens]